MIVKFFFDYVLSIFRKIDRAEIVVVLDFLIFVNEMLRRFSEQSDHESFEKFDWFHRFHCLSTLAPIQHTTWARLGRSGPVKWARKQSIERSFGAVFGCPRAIAF